jgi:hypothetical protein
LGEAVSSDRVLQAFVFNVFFDKLLWKSKRPRYDFDPAARDSSQIKLVYPSMIWRESAWKRPRILGFSIRKSRLVRGVSC